MNLNATLLGQVIIVSVLVIGLMSYYLGKRKTTTPKLATLIGIILSFIPPLGIIYLAVLVLKNDVNSAAVSESAG